MTLDGSLLQWYDKNRRTFPWRERVFVDADEHAYHTWICEVMSQQTLLSVLLPKYIQFLTELPTVYDLSACSEEKLRSLWKGLGYYARARNLQKGAQKIVHEFHGKFPRTYIDWQKIPGCGEYTSAIIASICYGEKVAAVDGNIVRVTSRLLNIQDSSVWTSTGYQRIFSFLQNHVSAKRPGDFNQALMDLGATVCKKHEAICHGCPLIESCLAQKNQTTELCPPIKPRKAPIAQNLYAILIRNPNNPKEIALYDRKKGFLKNTLGFPLYTPPLNFTIKEIQDLISKNESTSEVCHKIFKHSITHHKISGFAILVKNNKNKTSLQNLLDALQLNGNLKWIEEDDLKNHISSSLDQKIYKVLKMENQMLWA